MRKLRGIAWLLLLCPALLSSQSRVFYASGSVDEPPRRLSGPPVDYPRSLLRRHVQGFVQLAAIVDTTGRVEPASVEVLSTPDSGLNDAVEQMMLASQFSVGRLKGAAVRVMVQMGVDVRPPRLSATELVRSARAHLAAGRPDSALTLLDLALDSALAHPTDGERSYALLVAESTLWANWFYIGGTYSSYTLLRNTSATAVHATIMWRSDVRSSASSDSTTGSSSSLTMSAVARESRITWR